MLQVGRYCEVVFYQFFFLNAGNKRSYLPHLRMNADREIRFEATSIS